MGTLRQPVAPHVRINQGQKFRAFIQGGELIEDPNGPLLIIHKNKSEKSALDYKGSLTDGKYVPLSSIKPDHAESSVKDQRKISSREQPVKLNHTQISITNSSPTNTPVDCNANLRLNPMFNSSLDSSSGKSDEVQSSSFETLFPKMKMSKIGTYVLWNFLWGLLNESEHNHIIRWVSEREHKFHIVDPTKLAAFWGLFKQDPNMIERELQKILDLYVKNKLLGVGSNPQEFIFLIIPASMDSSTSF